MMKAFDVRTTSLEPGILLLEASAGTGKTWSLTSLAVRLLLEGRVASVDRLLLVTYTNKATDELRQRLRRRLSEAERALRGGPAEDPFLAWLCDEWQDDPAARRILTRARRDADLARVRTIHAFCEDVLAEGAFEAGLPLDGPVRSEGEELLRRAWHDTIRDTALSEVPFAGAAIRHFGFDPADLRLPQTVLRRHDHSWRPVTPPLEKAAEALSRALERVRFTELGAFVEAGPRNHWKTADRNECLRAFEDLAEGFDSARSDHRLAIFQLAPATVRGALNKKGLQRFEGSELERMLEPVGQAAQGLHTSLEQALVRRALERYAEIKDRHALVDFGDIIARARARLVDPVTGASLAQRIGSAFDAALVDEFQDTDAAQWEIFRRLFTKTDPDHLLVLVGDPKQAIYRFRGADIYAYLSARAAAGRIETLTRNYRSTKGLVEAVNAVFGAEPERSFALEEIVFEPVEAAREADSDAPTPMVFKWVEPGAKSTQGEGESAVLRELAADVVRRRGELPPGKRGEVAVLVHSHRQARRVMQALREAGVTAVLANAGDIHQSESMAEWRVVMRALLDPSNLRAQRRARATRLWGTPLSGLDEGETTLAEIELFARLRHTWNADGFAAMATTLVTRRGTVRRWLAEMDGERGVTDLRHGIELLNRVEVEGGFGPEALVRWAEAEANAAAPPGDEERLLRLDRESEAVQVMTNFTSKGLEFDTVYLPFAWEPRQIEMNLPLEVHDPATAEPVLDFAGDPELEPQAWLEEMASRLRMHYVELTRARERCVVYLAPVKRCFPHGAAAFLLARSGGRVSDDRGRWVREAVAEVGDAIDEAADRVKARMGHPALAFSVAAAGSAEPLVESAPAPRGPVALDYPASRLGALVPSPPLSYTALVHEIQDRAAVDLPVTDRSDPADAPATQRAGGIFGFARGARAGIFLHELLERADFSRAPDDADRAMAEKLLVQHGLELPGAHPGSIDPLEVCLELIERVRGERLPFGTARFASLGRAFREWEFLLPVTRLVPADLAGLVRRHWGGEDWIEAAAVRMARLPRHRLHGMLRGVVDLLFVDEDRWTVLDWKSNDLGAKAKAYTEDVMRRAMIEHDYVVQALLYVVAAHRYLRTRVRDYDYDRHVAGASYVFLRGLSGDPDTGWCNLTPPRALVAAIDDLLDGGGR